MEIRHIHIRNFRGFEETSFEFKSKFSVAIGNNGVGKSSLLNALQVGLGAILQSIPTLPANYVFRRQFRRGERFVKFDFDRKDFIANKDNPSIKMIGAWYHNDQKDEIPEPIMWERHYLLSNSTTHNRSHSGQIIYYGNFLYENHGSMPHVLYPILANFYINRTNAQVRRVDKRWKRMSRLEKGYFASLGDSVDFTGVYEWLYSFDTLVRDGREFEGTRDAMFDAIKKAIPYIKEIGFNTKYDEFEVLVDFEDGQPVERKLASFLSDGMKAVLNMVAEIAYRCVMLNGKLGERAIIDSPGIVLIDEIDMHLHPKWQKRIVPDLKNAFPKLQFIVTTHSPFIVQSLNSDELINLDTEKVEGLDEDPNRHSIEEVSTGEMGVPDVERSRLFLQMQNEAKEYFDLIKNKSDKEAIAKAKRKLDELRIKFNSDPAYVALLESELKEE